MKSAHAWAWVSIALALPAIALAQGAPKKGAAPAASASASASAHVAPSSSASAPAPPTRAASTLTSIAAQLAADLAKLPERSLVVSSTLASDAQATRPYDLTAAIASLVAGKRGSLARAKAEPMLLPSARVEAKSEDVIVYLKPSITNGKLHVAADVYPVPRSVWAKARNPEPGSIAHAFAEAPIDAEIRAYLAPIPLVTATVERAKNFESDVVALACGDVDGDGSNEIVSLSRRRVTTLRLRGGKVQILASRNWPDLAPIAPAPLREPIGFATIVAPHSASPFLDVALTDRAKSVRLDGGLREITSFGGIAVPDGDRTACTRLGGLVVTGPLGACDKGDGAPIASSVGGRYDAFASASLVTPRGELFRVWAGREDRNLEVRDDAGRKIGLEGVGAQLAVGDLDQDGDPEILGALDTLVAADDAVVVRSWSRDPKTAPADRLREIARYPAAAGVHALAVCPPDGPGRAPFVVATADEIWVVK